MSWSCLMMTSYDYDDFDEITIENSPVEYELIRS